MVKELKENTEVTMLPREAKESVHKGWIIKRLSPKYDRKEEDRMKLRKYLVVGNTKSNATESKVSTGPQI
jgi:hypothetical protein